MEWKEWNGMEMEGMEWKEMDKWNGMKGWNGRKE